MFNVGGGEILAILVIALIVLGPDKLPNAARQAGKYLNEFRRISSGFQDEIRSAMDLTTTESAPVDLPPAEPASSEVTASNPASSEPVGSAEPVDQAQHVDQADHADPVEATATGTDPDVAAATDHVAMDDDARTTPDAGQVPPGPAAA